MATVGQILQRYGATVMDNTRGLSAAIEDFKRARRRADVQQLLARLGGNKPDELLSFEQVRRLVGGDALLPRGLRDIPLDAIVGSVGRYRDFNRQFLPKEQTQAGRWAGVRAAVETKGLEPIAVYQIGDVYFVLDGHHRVSVARQMGQKAIEAYVTEVPSKAPLAASDNPDDIILKAEHARFLEDTRVNELHPEVEPRVTSPGAYEDLREHISVHHYFMCQEQKRDVPYQEAVGHWLEQVYLPAVHEIRRLALLRDFPKRTEADLYLWLMKHKVDLASRVGWDLSTQEAAAHLWNRLYTKPRRTWERVKRGVGRLGPVPTEWKLETRAADVQQSIFARILVPISGVDTSWTAVDQAILVAQRERSELRGVHVLTGEDARETNRADDIRQEFENRIKSAGLKGGLVLEQGSISKRVSERSHWSDLVILHLKHAPGPQPMQRLLSGLRAFLQRSPRPVLVVPQSSELKHALLAYDGSAKANEALYLAAYIAGKWGTPITVTTSRDRRMRESLMQQKAKGYLISRGIEANYVQRRGPAGPEIVATAAEHGCDFILMGGYKVSTLIEVMWGSTLDHVLREYKGPTWVCA